MLWYRKELDKPPHTASAENFLVTRAVHVVSSMSQVLLTRLEDIVHQGSNPFLCGTGYTTYQKDGTVQTMTLMRFQLSTPCGRVVRSKWSYGRDYSHRKTLFRAHSRSFTRKTLMLHRQLHRAFGNLRVGMRSMQSNLLWLECCRACRVIQRCR